MQAENLKIFFSYARTDSEFVLKLAQDMRSAGVDLWIDQLDIPAGVRWDETVENALQACPRLIIILSPKSVTSQNVMDEVAFAIEKNKEIIPIFYRNCDIPFRLARIQRIDFTRNYNDALAKLLTVLDANDPDKKIELPSKKPYFLQRSANTRILIILFIVAVVVSLGMMMKVKWDDWKPSKSGQKLPNNLLEGGWEHTGQGGKRSLYICRSDDNGGKNPGKLLGTDCFIPFGGKESIQQTYEVLVMSHVHWVQATSLDPLPSYAVEGGYEPNGLPLYICRAKKSTADGGIQGIHPGKLSDGICYIGFNWREEQYKDYEILVKDSN